MITPQFRREVGKLRDEGWTWPEIAELTGRSMRTCTRALESRSPTRCAQRGCQEAVASVQARYCRAHARELMSANKKGTGPQQKQIMRLVRSKGLVTSEQVQDATGMTSGSTHQALYRLVKNGMLERPVRGHYRLPVGHDDN